MDCRKMPGSIHHGPRDHFSPSNRQDSMKIVIIGAGVVGTTLTQYFSKEGHDVVVIDRDAALIRHIDETIDAQGIQGDAADHRILNDAGLESADLVLAVTDSDESNIVITLIAQAKNPKARIITRVRREHYISNRDLWSGQRFSNTLLISPERAASEAVKYLLEVDHSFEVIPFLDGAIRVAGFRLDDQSPLVGKPLREVTSDPKSRALVVAVVRGEEVMVPSGNYVLHKDDLIYVTLLGGKNASIPAPLLGRTNGRHPKTVIVGGGWKGLRVAQILEESGHPAVVVERDRERCTVLASRLPKTVVIHGDGASSSVLSDVGMKNVNFVAITGHEEVNFLLALLGNKLGANRSIALMDNESYLSMAHTMGIDAAVSPKLSAVRDILRFLNKDQVMDAAPMLNGRVDALLVEMPRDSRIVERPLKMAGIPQGIIIAAVARGNETIIPNGDTVLHAGDKAMIVTHRSLHPKLDAILSPDKS